LPPAFMTGSRPTPAFHAWLAPLIAEARPYADALLDAPA